jgi:hypothetical protein
MGSGNPIDNASHFAPQNTVSPQNATPEQKERFDDAYQKMLELLKNKKCGDLFGGEKKALEALDPKNTTFSFVSRGGPTEVLGNKFLYDKEDARLEGKNISINSDGRFMVDGGTLPVRMRDGSTQITPGFDSFTVLNGENRSRVQMPSDINTAAFILLHELGHRCGIFGKDDKDAGDSDKGERNNYKIWEACFKAQS